MIKLEQINRIPNKIKREILRIPTCQSISELVYKEELKRHVNSLPGISPLDSTWVDSLRQEGAFVTSLQALKIPSTSLLIAGAEKLLPELRAVSRNRENAIRLPLSRLMNYPEIFLWALDERLLNIIENYIGLPVLYHGADLRREIANGETIDIRQWHIDVEDRHMIRIIVYLNDVSVDGGAFEYLSKHSTSLASQILKYSSGFVSDQVMETVVDTSDWKPCTGRSGTVIFADTCKVFHRAKAPVVSDRFSITFSYTSRRPISIYGKVPFSKDELLEISSRLSTRQRECLSGNRDLI